jgi:hypothetical protein
MNSSNNKALKQSSSSLSFLSADFISPPNQATPSITATFITFEGHFVSFTKLIASLNLLSCEPPKSVINLAVLLHIFCY